MILKRSAVRAWIKPMIVAATLESAAKLAFAACSPVAYHGASDLDPTFHLTWDVCPPVVEFNLTVTPDSPPANYWIALGYGAAGQGVDNGHSSSVAGSSAIDMTFCWVDASSMGYTTDFFSLGRSVCTPATINAIPCTGADAARTSAGGMDNIVSYSAVRAGSDFLCTFQRPLAAGESLDNAIAENVEQPIFWAYGPTTSSGTWPYKAQYHLARGGSLLTIYNTAELVFHDGFE